MRKNLLAAAAIAALLSTSALAQNSNTQNATATGDWQASKLIHLNVYNSQNEKIGDIKELMFNKSGQIDQVAIGVGGFLGMGEHDVAVKFGDLKWVDQPVASTTSTQTRPATTGMTNTTTTTASAPRAADKRTYPDHAVLDATKDQLKAMPQFDYNK